MIVKTKDPKAKFMIESGVKKQMGSITAAPMKDDA